MTSFLDIHFRLSFLQWETATLVCLCISFFGSWGPRRNLGITFELVILKLFSTTTPGTDVLIFLNIFAKKFGEKIGVFDSKQG
jgi:hypothetical protein